MRKVCYVLGIGVKWIGLIGFVNRVFITILDFFYKI